jgi:hypothetical protein
MGFLDASALMKQTQVTILTAGFQIRCTLRSMGLMQTFLNDEQKALFTLDDVTLFGLEMGNPATSIRLAELHIRKEQIHLIAFPTMLSRDESGLLPRTETLAVYTSHFVIQGSFHMGTDSLVSDFMEISKSQFIGVSNLAVFPLFQAQTAVVQQAPIGFIYRDAVRMHHQI